MKDKVVLITGASSGIGRALALKFSREGSRVMLGARNQHELASLHQAISQSGGGSHWYPLDVTDKAQCEAFVSEAVRHFGKIDVLINNAGISMRALLRDLDTAVIEQVMQVNFFGTVYCTKAALPHLIESRGSLVGVSSIAGYRGLPGRSGYSASKFAMHGFLESIRTETLMQGLHVLIACPGFTESNIRKAALVADGSNQIDTPLDENKLMSAEAVADHIYKAILGRKRSMVLTTQGKFTVFLNKWFPGLMDKMVYRHFVKEADSPLK